MKGSIIDELMKNRREARSMTIIAGAVFPFGAVVGSDSEQMTEVGVDQDGRWRSIAEPIMVLKVFQHEQSASVIATAGDSRVFTGPLLEEVELSVWLKTFLDNETESLDARQLASNLEAAFGRRDIHYGQVLPSRFLIYGRIDGSIACFELSNEQDIVNEVPVGRRVMRLVRLMNDDDENPWVSSGGFIAAQRLLERLFLRRSNDIEDIILLMPHRNPDFRLSNDLEERIEATQQIAVTNLLSASNWLRSSLECVRDIWIEAGEQGIGGDIQIIVID